MEFVMAYLRQKKGTIGMFVLCSFLFLSTFFLYRLPIEAVLYPIGICTAFLLAAFLWEMYKARKKHLQLQSICRMPAVLMTDFPQADTLFDSDYQAIIQALRQQQNQLQTDMDLRYQDMVDYYTTWAHQIKTPIAAMRLTLQMQDSAFSRQLSQDLHRIEQYVEMVLTFLRLDSDATDYVFRQQELDPIVRDAVKKFAGQFIQKKIRLCYQPLQSTVLTDEKWLSFVMEQILSNALKYTTSGSISIEWQEPDILCIRDTGIGIAAEDLPRVFEKSYTGYNGRSKQKSSGIGLYLCKRICSNLGHSIDITSAVGEGTTVCIHLSRKPIKVE